MAPQPASHPDVTLNLALAAIDSSNAPPGSVAVSRSKYSLKLRSLPWRISAIRTIGNSIFVPGVVFYRLGGPSFGSKREKKSRMAVKKAPGCLYQCWTSPMHALLRS
jgi:hypothetical protein